MDGRAQCYEGEKGEMGRNLTVYGEEDNTEKRNEAQINKIRMFEKIIGKYIVYDIYEYIHSLYECVYIFKLFKTEFLCV